MSEVNYLKILLVDDDEDDFFITSELIKRAPGISAKVEWCDKHEIALEHMIGRKYDLYFVDYRLGAKSGIDLLKAAIQNNCEEPIVLLTGKGNYNIDKKATEIGATDYLIKSELTVEKIERCIRYAIDRTSVLKALKANERKYRTIFEKSKDIVFIADENLNFNKLNDAVETVLGYGIDESIEMSLYDFIEQAQHKRYLQHILKSREEIKDWEVLLLTKNGEQKSCLVTATKELNEDHNIYIHGIIHDITTLKKVEKSNLQTEKLGLTARLMQILAHEVRNPLNNITLSVEQMMQDTEDENMVGYLNIIDRNSKRINTLISELLNTSRRTEIKLQPYIVQSILDDVVNAAIDRINLKRIKLELKYSPDAVYVMADKEKLTIALLNIVINAIEAMEEESGKLFICLELDGGNVLIKIADTGCGINEENMTKLFEPYFTQKRNGVGLGLAFTLNIIQSHFGSIDVTSQLAKGTQFIIVLPLNNTVSLKEISHAQ